MVGFFMSVLKFKVNILDFDVDDIYPAEVSIVDGLISDVLRLDDADSLDFEGVLIPGFIDSHVHIESSMLSPSNFAKAVIPHGTTSVVADAHEIVNVLGKEGMDFMIEDGSSVPFDFYFSAPSCVPATVFETSGAVFDAEDIEELFKNPRVICLGEMMNFPGVIAGDEEVIRKLDVANELGFPIDGHAPLLSGEDLEKYVSYGISTDHECSNFNEAIEKKKLGVKIMVREGSSAKDMDALLNINNRVEYWTKESEFGNITVEEYKKLLKHPIFDFLVTDDKNPKDLQKGHLNTLIKKARTKDIDPIEAIKMVTINPAKHYKLNSGEIKKGKKANLLLIDNINNLNIKKTIINGKIVYENEKILFETKKPQIKNTFNVNPKKPEDFDIKSNKKTVKVNVIEAIDKELTTNKITTTLKTQKQTIQPNIKEDILKVSVVERYGHNNMANAFIKGFKLKTGAIATSVSHDSHNIITVGTNSNDMAKAVNTIIKNHGGIAISNENKIETLKLPIAGLMSDQKIETTAKQLEKMGQTVKKMGSTLESPFMTLSFMTLLVIPELKISDKGLFNLIEFKQEDVIIE